MLGWRARRVVAAGAAAVVVATVLVLPATSAPTRSSTAEASKQLVLKVKLPSSGGFSFARFQVVRKAGAPQRAVGSPRKVRLAVLDGAKLPRGLVAVARIGRLPGNRGYDVFVTVIRKRGLRATAVARRQSDGGLGFGIAVIFGTALGLEFDIDSEFTVLLPGEPSQYERNLRVQRDLRDLAAGWKKPAKPASAQTLADLFKEPDGSSVSLLGNERPIPVLVDVLALIDELAAPNASATDKKDALAEIIDEIERQLQDDLDGNGSVGATKPAPPGSKLFRYSIPGFTVSFTGPKANQSPAVIDRADVGSGCGDPARGTWAIPIAISGFGLPFSATRAVSFAKQNPLVLMGNNFTSNTGGSSTASVRVSLRYVGGNTPTVKVETTAVGDITGLTAPAGPLRVTLTKVTVC